MESDVCRFVSKMSIVLERKAVVMEHLSTVFDGLDVMDPHVA